MCKFRYKHRLQHARRFEDPLSPLNKPKPGLWRASIAIRDLSRLTAGRRPEVEARLFAKLKEV